MSMPLAATASDCAETRSWSGRAPSRDAPEPASDVVSLLEALDVRIAAGLTSLRAGHTARDHLDQARELISWSLRRAALSALSVQRERTDQSSAEALHFGGLPPRKARRIAEYIELRLAEKLSVGELANLAGLSSGYFCRAFRVTFKLPPRQYIEARRIERAQRLMIETDQSLLHIALACGINDAAHFCRIFRSVVGLSPSRWRRMHRD